MVAPDILRVCRARASDELDAFDVCDVGVLDVGRERAARENEIFREHRLRRRLDRIFCNVILRIGKRERRRLRSFEVKNNFS